MIWPVGTSMHGDDWPPDPVVQKCNFLSKYRPSRASTTCDHMLCATRNPLGPI